MLNLKFVASSTSDLRIKYRDDGSSSILNSIVEDVSNEMCLQLIRQIMAEKISIDNESKYLRNSLIEEICLEMCRKVAMEVLDDLDSRNKIRDRACIFVSNSIMEEVCHELCHKVAREVLDEQEKVIIPDIPKPPSIRELFAHAGYIGICLIEEVSSEFCRQIAADAIKDWENWNLIISRVSHAIADALINEVCDKMCNEVAAEVLDDIVEDEEPILSEKSSLTLTSTLSTTVSQGEIFTELYR